MKQLLMMTVLALSGVPAAIAQPVVIPSAGSGITGDCQPPSASEFLLFATARTLEAQSLLRSKAPTDATTIVCRYQGNTVMRVSGFASEPLASAWGQYLMQTTGIPTTIVRPEPVTLVSSPAPVILTSGSGNGGVGKRFAPGVYKPQTLASGYAVLVNYNNRPDVAVQLGQALSQDMGVAVYGERPYLLVMQTGEMTAANAVVKLLSDRGFLALRVEAKSVVVLRPIVKR